MKELFSFREGSLYCHHSLDQKPAPEAFTMHAHETPELYLFLSGKGEFLVEGSHYPLSPGDILLMRSAETHKLLISPDEPYRRLAVHFPAEVFRSLDPEGNLFKAFLDRPLGRLNDYPASRYPGLHRILEDLTLTPGQEKLQILSRLLLLLTEIAALFPKISGEEKAPATLSAQLVAHINRHLFEELSVESLSRHFARSSSQLGRLFKEATGTSMWDYINTKRMLAARAMLERGDSAAAVSERCGYADYSAFFRAYKKRFGQAPSAEKIR